MNEEVCQEMIEEIDVVDIQKTSKVFELSVIGAIGLYLFFFGLVQGLITLPFWYLESLPITKTNIFVDTVFRLTAEIVPSCLSIYLVLKSMSNEKEVKVSIKRDYSMGWKLVILMVVSIIAYRVFYHYTLGQYVYNIPFSESMEEAIADLMKNKFYLYISVIVIGPILEEIIYRGIFLQGFLNKYKPLLAIVISALLFASIHGNLPQFPNTFILGLVFGYIYYKTDSIFLPVVCHMANNAWAFVDETIFFSSGWVGIVVSSIAFITLAYLFVKAMNKSYKKGVRNYGRNQRTETLE